MTFREWWGTVKDTPEVEAVAGIGGAVPLAVILAWQAGEAFGRARAARMCRAEADVYRAQEPDFHEAEDVLDDVAKLIEKGDLKPDGSAPFR